MQERLKIEEEERQRLKIVKKQDTNMMAEMNRKNTLIKEEEERRLSELKIMEEKRLQEKLQLESMIQREKEAIKKGIVTRRTDDPYGQGFGFVKTGYVSSQKLSILQRAASVERSSPTPSNNSKGLRVTWAESPGSSRPASKMSGTDRVAEMDSLALRTETPPLAAEWAVSKGDMENHGSMMQQQQQRSVFSSSSAVSSSSMAATSSVNSLQTNNTALQQQNMSAAFQSQKAFSTSSSFKSESSKSATMSSSMKSSSSSFKQSSHINTFEAFPGMGGIENLNLEGGKAMTSNSMLQ
jgi:hypothetical protein